VVVGSLVEKVEVVIVVVVEVVVAEEVVSIDVVVFVIALSSVLVSEMGWPVAVRGIFADYVENKQVEKEEKLLENYLDSKKLSEYKAMETSGVVIYKNMTDEFFMDMQTIDRTKLKGDIAMYNKFCEDRKCNLSIKDLLNTDDTEKSKDNIDDFVNWRTTLTTETERLDPIEVWHGVALQNGISEEEFVEYNTDIFTEEDWENIVNSYKKLDEDDHVHIEHKLSPEAIKSLENKKGVKNKCFTND